MISPRLMDLCDETLCQVCVHVSDKLCHDSLCHCPDRYWRKDEPNNGGGNPQWGEEDCVHIRSGVNAKNSWNDLQCDKSLKWICAKMS